MLIRGRCHCGNISFALAWEPEPTMIPARSCTCTFCTKHGGVWTSCPTGRLEVSVEDWTRVARYEFGTKTAEFLVCTRCGIVPVVTSLIENHLYAVVNVNAFEDVDVSRVQRAVASFDGEDEPTRLARRKRRWIADVEFVEARG